METLWTNFPRSPYLNCRSNNKLDLVIPKLWWMTYDFIHDWTLFRMQFVLPVTCPWVLFCYMKKLNGWPGLSKFSAGKYGGKVSAASVILTKSHTEWQLAHNILARAIHPIGWRRGQDIVLFVCTLDNSENNWFLVVCTYLWHAYTRARTHVHTHNQTNTITHIHFCLFIRYVEFVLWDEHNHKNFSAV